MVSLNDDALVSKRLNVGCNSLDRKVRAFMLSALVGHRVCEDVLGDRVVHYPYRCWTVVVIDAVFDLWHIAIAQITVVERDHR